MNEKLEQANKLQKQIEELENFLFVVVEFDEKSKAIPSVWCSMTKTIKVELSLFGFRGFGCGNHSQTVVIPNLIRNNLIDSCKARLQELKDELATKLS